MKIAVLTSGGVDSAVALHLLKQQGYEVTAFYLKIWLEDEFAFLGDCPWEEDLAYVRKICEALKINLEVISMQRDYWDRVVSYTIDECKAGRTPNPDIFCNQQIKFGQFYHKIDSTFDKVATGHYAQVEQIKDLFWLKTAPDPVKDQTYFLSHLSQSQLSRAMFPIGEYKKSRVRELAEEFDLPNKNRKDSQGICFLGKIPYREFIKQHLGEKPGDFVEKSTGKVVGEHKGFWFYTIGQRTGLGLGGGPWFVIEKDVENNVIYLANGYQPEAVYQDQFLVENPNWISQPLSSDEDLMVKIRHGAKMHSAKVQVLKEGILQVGLSEKAHGVAPGQFAVFYRKSDLDDRYFCLGGGRIKE